MLFSRLDPIVKYHQRKLKKTEKKRAKDNKDTESHKRLSYRDTFRKIYVL